MAFVNRKDELKLLDELLDEPGAQLVLVSGRRRVGKTTLLTRWARRTGCRSSTGWPGGTRASC